MPVIAILVIVFSVIMIIAKSKKSKTKIQEPTPDPFEIMQIGTRGIQLLESLHIIETTKNADTLTGRIKYILEFYPSFTALGMFPKQYSHEAEKAVNSYTERYPGRVISPKSMSLLLTPSMNEMGTHIANCIVVSYGEIVKSEVQHIETLKRESAKQKRIEGIIETGYRMKYLFKTHDLPDTGQTAAIEEIRKQFYHTKKAAK